MNDPFANPEKHNPEAGFSQGAASVAQAANDLRVAAGEKARDLAQTATAQVSALKEKAVESAHHFREVAADKASHLRDTATERWEESRVKAQEFQVTAEDYIRQNPTKAVFGALGVGFLVGLILRR